MAGIAEHVLFGRNLNQPIAGVGWPSSLPQLALGIKVNQSFVGVVAAGVSATVIIFK